MKYHIVFLCLFVILVCAACSPQVQPETPTELADPRPYVEQLCLALADFDAADNRIQTVSLSRIQQLQGQSFSQQYQQTLYCQSLTSDAPVLYVQTDAAFGNLTVQYTRHWKDGNKYLSISGRCFSSVSAVDAFLSGSIPAAMIQPALYAQVTASQQADQVILTFSQPSSPESWLDPQSQTRFHTAEATAILDSGGKVKELRLRCQFSDGSMEITSQVSLPEQLDLSGKLSPVSPDAVELTDADIPLQLLQSAGRLYEAADILSNCTETIDSEAIRTQRIQQTQLQLSGKGSSLRAEVSYLLSVAETAGTIHRSVTREQFQNGSFSRSIDGGEPVSDPNMTPEQMRQRCEDILLTSMFAISHLDRGEVTEQEDTLTFHFTGSEAMTASLCQNIYTLLGADLDSVSQESLSEPVTGYLTVDISTGLPTGAGMSMTRSHVINGTEFALLYRLEQTYQFEGVMFPAQS